MTRIKRSIGRLALCICAYMYVNASHRDKEQPRKRSLILKSLRDHNSSGLDRNMQRLAYMIRRLFPCNHVLKRPYWLGDEYARILIGLRLRKKVLEWLHSKTEYIELSVEDLLGGIMLDHRPNRIMLYKKFEERGKKMNHSVTLCIRRFS
jgi:hypothetical protein